MIAADNRAFASGIRAVRPSAPSPVVSFVSAAQRRAAPVRDVTNAPLAALADAGLRHSFHSWHGISGQRYTFAVAPSLRVDPSLLDGAVAIVTERKDGARRVLFIGLGNDVPAALARSGANIELHYHLLATTPSARDALIVDLLGQS